MLEKFGTVFKSQFHKKIYCESSDWVFEFGKQEVEFLQANTKDVLAILDFHFQLIRKGDDKYLLFKLTGKTKEKKNFYEFKDGGDFYIRGHKANVQEISVLEFEDQSKSVLSEEDHQNVLLLHKAFIERENQRREELINSFAQIVPEQKKVSAPEKEEKFKTESVKERIIETFNDLKNKKNPKKTVKNSDIDLNPKNAIFEYPVDFNKKGGLWVTLEKDFENTDEFWSELKDYYRKNPEQIKEKLYFLKDVDVPPVFSKKDSSLSLPNLHDVFLRRISERIEELDTQKADLEGNLKELEDSLVGRGIVPDEVADYQEMVNSKKGISECLARARHALEEYEKNSKSLEKEAKKFIEDRFFLDIHGQFPLVSKYHEFITMKLLDLNQEINFLHRKHFELEHLLIKRLRDLEDAKQFKEKVVKLEQEELIEAFKEDNKEFFASFETRKQKDVLRKMGDIHESTAEIQRHIENEKKKIQYYMDNLNDLGRYEKYEHYLFQHKKRKQNFRRQTNEFNRYVYKLKLLVEERERKFKDFFSGIRSNVLDFQKEVVDTRFQLDESARTSLGHLWNQWHQNADPCIQILFTRAAQIIDSFSAIPAIQIKRIYRFQQRLKEEAWKRQMEWERIFAEIQNEFRESGYEAEEQLASEFEDKYIKQLDEADLKLSPSTENVLFIPPEKFSLANQKDNTIGLNPKFLDDDKFIVIDQVWTSLTPEQEAKLNNEFNVEKERKKQEDYENAMQFLKREQLKGFQNKWTAKKASIEQFSYPFTQKEKIEKMSAIEEDQLNLIKKDHYLFSNTLGEFKDTLYNISKKLFQNKSIRMVKSDIKFTNDGFVEDGNTEIFTRQDYFIKSPDSKLFKELSEDIDLSHDEAIFNEPDEEVLEYISDPEYVERMHRNQEFTPSSLPTLGDVVKMGADKYKSAKEKKEYELDLLRERVLLLDDEVKKIKSYHDDQSKNLELVLSDKYEIFEDMQNDLNGMKKFLSEKENEFESIIASVEKDLEISLGEINQNLFKEEEPLETKKSLFRWFGKFISGEREKRRK